MPLKLALNPITAKLDLVQNLSAYAKLAISITTTELQTHITNSTLIPNQWYLLTDFQNICTIADSQGTSDYTTGDVEQIYVKALSTNTLHREAISKTFPDEIVEFNPTFSDETASLYLYAHGDGADVINDETDFTADTYGTSVNELQFGGTLVDEFDDATISNINYYNGVAGNVFYLYGYEKDNIWEYDDVNDIFKINKTPYNYYDTYESGSSSFFTISITDATHFVLGCPAWMDFTNQRPDDSSFYLSDGVNGETYDFNQKGVTWDYDVGTDTITILSGAVSLTDPNLTIEFSGTSYCDNTAYNTQFSTNGLLDLSADGSSFEIDSSYVVYSVKGKIEARRNTKFDFYCQADYRVQKVRRYKALCNNWSAGTYNPGNIVRYNSYIYICLKTTTQTPSTSATNWFRMFGDNYNLSNSISIACSVQSINVSLAIDTASYTDMYICNDNISNFDAFTEKINTQILKHPDADQTKPLNVTFYAGFHGCQNAIITANETHFISNITNSTVNFVNSVLNSAINYSTITSGQYCILWQNTYLSALQLYQVLASSIDYTTIIIASGSIFRNGITKSIMTSVSNTIFAAKPTECNIINLSITDQWGSSFSGTYINKMYNCTFNSSVTACQFNGDTYYTNWYSNCYRNKFMSNVYGSSNTVRQTFYYMADNFFAQNVSLNYFSTTGGDITTNKFFGSFSNNFTSASPSYSTYAISTNTFNGDFIYNTGGGRFSITNNFAYAFKYNTFSNSTSYYARLSENFFGGDFGASGVGNTFNNTTADFNLRYNASTNVWYQNTFTRGSIEYNTFLGRVSLNTFGGTTTQDFTYNVCSLYFSSNVINASVTKNFYPPYYQGYTINSTTSFNYMNVLNAVGKNTFATNLAAYTVEEQYSVVYLTNTGASQTITLPAAKGTKRLITIVKITSAAYQCTIDGNASETINDVLTYTLNKQYQAVTLQDKETGKWYSVEACNDNLYLGVGYIPYGDSNGEETAEADFTYDASTNTLSVPNIETTYLKVQGTEDEAVIARYRDKDGEDVFTAMGSIGDGDFEFKIGDYAGAGNETGYKLDYANEKHTFKNDVEMDDVTADSLTTEQVKATDADGLLLTDDGNNGIFVEDGGNVGIGTTNPSYKLDVSGSIRSSSFSDGILSIGGAQINRATGYIEVQWAPTGGTTGLRIFGSTAYPVVFKGDTGNVGIGTTAPDKKLEINSSDGNNLRLTYNDSNGSATNYADFTTSSDGNLTITPSGGSTSNIGHFHMLSDTNKIYLGAGDDASLDYDGTNIKIVSDLTAPSDLVIDCGTQKTLALTVPVYEDIRVSSGNIDRPGGSDPTWVSVAPGGSGTSTYLLEFAKNNYGTFTVQIPHSYKTGEDIKVHLHWTPGDYGSTESGNTVGWKIDYTWANIGDNFGTMSTADLSDTCDGTDWKHQMTPDVTINGHTVAKGISSMLICNVKRTDTGDDDTWTGTATGELPLLLEVDFHFPVDTIGSRDWGLK